MIRKLPWAEIMVAAVVVAAGAGVYLYAHRDEGRLEESKRAGTEVVAGLRAYHDEHETYPDRLDELVPRYLAAVPQPTWGLGRWSYERYSPADGSVYFRIAVAENASGYPVLYYDVAAARWVLNN